MYCVDIYAVDDLLTEGINKGEVDNGDGTFRPYSRVSFTAERSMNKKRLKCIAVGNSERVWPASPRASKVLTVHCKSDYTWQSL